MVQRLSVLGLLVLVHATACHRTVDDEPEVELIEHRIEPCRSLCDLAYDPQCGQDPPPDRTVDGCFEQCASDNPQGFSWAHQDDGTDACVAEWLARLRCLEALDCQDRYDAFNGGPQPASLPCQEEALAVTLCVNANPRADRGESSS